MLHKKIEILISQAATKNRQVNQTNQNHQQGQSERTRRKSQNLRAQTFYLLTTVGTYFMKANSTVFMAIVQAAMMVVSIAERAKGLSAPEEIQITPSLIKIQGQMAPQTRHATNRRARRREEGKTDPSALRGLLYTLSRLMTVVPKTTTLSLTILIPLKRH